MEWLIGYLLVGLIITIIDMSMFFYENPKSISHAFSSPIIFVGYSLIAAVSIAIWQIGLVSVIKNVRSYYNG